jgi:hypothetical protein
MRMLKITPSPRLDARAHDDHSAWAIAACALLLTGVLGLAGCESDDASGDSDTSDDSDETGVVLSANPTQATYTAGQAITLEYRLTNQGNGAVAASPLANGAIEIVQVVRDGVVLTEMRKPVLADEPLGAQLRERLVMLDSGESVGGRLGSRFDNGMDGFALAVMQIPSGRDLPELVLYDVSVPGDYRVDLAYEYQANQGPPEAFFGRSNEVSVAFTVDPTPSP